MKAKPKLHILCDPKLNLYLNVETKAIIPPKTNKIAHISVRDFRKIGLELKNVYWASAISKISFK